MSVYYACIVLYDNKIQYLSYRRQGKLGRFSICLLVQGKGTITFALPNSLGEVLISGR